MLVALAVAGRVVAADQAPTPSWTDRITLSVSNRIRGEFVDWFAPPPGLTAPGAERYNFLGNRFRLGVRALFDPFELNLQFQDTVLANLPEDASLAPPVGNLGTGAIYFANTRRTPQSAPVFKLGNLTWRGQGVTATFGRLEYRDGLEVVPTDPTLAFLARTRGRGAAGRALRIHARGRSFDGARIAYDRSDWNLTALGVRPTQGGFEIDANRELDIEIAGLAWTLRRLPKGRPSEWRIFYLYYRDGRDDTGRSTIGRSPCASAIVTPIAINTIGSSAISAVDVGPGIADGLLWGVDADRLLGEADPGLLGVGHRGRLPAPETPAVAVAAGGLESFVGRQRPQRRPPPHVLPAGPDGAPYARTPFFNR